MKGRGRRLDPAPITGGIEIQSLVDDFFLSCNAGRLREACHPAQLPDTVVCCADSTIALSNFKAQQTH